MQRYKSPGQDHEGLEVVPTSDDPEALPNHQTSSSKPSLNGNYARHTTVKPLPPDESRTIFGLRKGIFFLSLLLALAVVTAAVIGGVLGTKQTTKCNTNATSTTSPTTQPASSSSSIAINNFVAPSDVTIAVDCPTINQTTTKNPYLPNGGTYSYITTCGQDCADENIFPIWAYSLDMCVQACVNMNGGAATGVQCRAVAFRADMANVTTLGGNCFLKTNCSQPVTQAVAIAHAVLTT